MLTLSGRAIDVRNLNGRDRPLILRLADKPQIAPGMKPKIAYWISATSEAPEGLAAYIAVEDHRNIIEQLPAEAPTVVLPNEFSYLRAGDVIRIGPQDGRVRILYRRNSRHNSFLVTERCDNYCLMCSQPPKDIDDGWIVDEILETIPLIDPDTEEIGFTGGEPTLLGDRFLEILKSCKSQIPKTSIHVLSNGRRFSDRSFAQAWAALQHQDLMVGIPLYSDVSTIHDYVVQADGAYDETVRGILNLKELQQQVEIRVVLHQQTYRDLPRLAEFITRNLLFVDHVALMGLEIMGFTRANLGSLWIDPFDYQKELCEAVQILDSCRMSVSVYNLPLCLLDRRVWPFARQSISDWKNEYLPQCGECAVRDECAGFFFSARCKRSDRIVPISVAGLGEMVSEDRNEARNPRKTDADSAHTS